MYQLLVKFFVRLGLLAYYVNFLPCGLLASDRVAWERPQCRQVPENSNIRQLQFPSVFHTLACVMFTIYSQHVR